MASYRVDHAGGKEDIIPVRDTTCGPLFTNRRIPTFAGILYSGFQEASTDCALLTPYGYTGNWAVKAATSRRVVASTVSSVWGFWVAIASRTSPTQWPMR